MQRKSTDYKRLVGTYKQTREVRLRPLAELEAELAFARDTLDDIRFNLSVSSEAIKKYGMQMVFVSLDKNSHFIERVKINPALRVQHEAVRHIKSLTLEIAFLEEQVVRASEKKNEDDDFAELGFTV